VPSGINTTKSDILIYVIDSTEKYIIYWININHLKNYINTNYNKMKLEKLNQLIQMVILMVNIITGI
jgi:hypothetical protein